MPVQKLTSTDAFVVRDLADAPRSMGVVRCAPKILVDGATWLARSVTYACASGGIRAGGASAGVNAAADGRAAALAAFDTEAASSGDLVLDAGKGVDPADLPALAAADPRPADVRAAAPALLAAGIVAAAGAARGGLDGAAVAVEGLDAMPAADAAALLDALGAAGATIAGLTVTAPAEVAAALAAGGLADLVADPSAPANRVLGTAADVLLVGSKAGALEHNGAAFVRAGVVVPWGPVAVSAKALAVLGRAGVVVVPDFLSTAGPVWAWAGDDASGPDPARMGRRVAASVADVLGHEHGAYLGACFRAEAFLGSWCPALPFGRPLA